MKSGRRVHKLQKVRSSVGVSVYSHLILSLHNSSVLIQMICQLIIRKKFLRYKHHYSAFNHFQVRT
jgi:hypothetical protein